MKNQVVMTDVGVFSRDEIETPSGTFCVYRPIRQTERLLSCPVTIFRGAYDKRLENEQIAMTIDSFRVAGALLGAGIGVKKMQFCGSDLVNDEIEITIEVGGVSQKMLVGAHGDCRMLPYEIFYGLFAREQAIDRGAIDINSLYAGDGEESKSKELRDRNEKENEP